MLSYAGNQREDALADAVRLALSQAIGDTSSPTPPFENINAQLAYLHWLGNMSTRLQSRMPDRATRLQFLEMVWYESKRAGLDPALVLALIQVESAYRKYAISPVGARGYMQVMPFWSRLIGKGNPSELFDTRANLRYGCSILRMYLDMEKGNLYYALGRYNGSRGRPQYPNAVLTASQRWEYTPPVTSYRIAFKAN